MMKKKIWGVRAQLITVIVILTLAATSLIGVLSVKLLEQNYFNNRVSEAMLTAEILGAAARDDISVAERVAMELQRAGRVSSIDVADRRGKMVFKGAYSTRRARVTNTPAEMIYHDTNMIVRHIYYKGLLWKNFGELTVSKRLKGGGNILFTVSLSDVLEELSQIKRVILLFAVVDALIIIMIGLYFLRSLIIRPIGALERTASQIAAGDLGVRVDIESDDEMGSLAKSFNSMADSVQDKVEKIERTNKEVMAARDDLVATQERLVMSEKLATAGCLAAGIAHEIGNPLGAVQGYLDLLAKSDEGLLSAQEKDEIMERMDVELARINMIVREFLDLSRPSKGQESSVEVNELVRDSVNVLSAHKEYEAVDTVFRLAPGALNAEIDGSKLKQVFMNLLLNAASAMDGRGTVTIKSFVRDSERGGRDVIVSFTDTGCGINEEERSRVFDPFYSTKDPGRGTGLGLFVTDAIVKAYGGEINVLDSDGPAAGTTFEVLLKERRRK